MDTRQICFVIFHCIMEIYIFQIPTPKQASRYCCCKTQTFLTKGTVQFNYKDHHTIYWCIILIHISHSFCILYIVRLMIRSNIISFHLVRFTYIHVYVILLYYFTCCSHLIVLEAKEKGAV